MNFIKKNVPVARGMQTTKYDKWLESFTIPGDSLFFTESDLTRPAASQAAKRLTLLDSKKQGRKFHSYYDTVEGMVVVRVRPAGEVPSAEELQSSDQEAEEIEETDVPEPEAVDLHEKQDTIEFP